MPDFSFVPTGGVTLDSLGAYLALPNVVAVGGSWIAGGKDIAARDWARISANAMLPLRKQPSSADRRDGIFAAKDEFGRRLTRR